MKFRWRLEIGVCDICQNSICLRFLAVLLVVLADPDFRLLVAQFFYILNSCTVGFVWLLY